MQLPTTLELLTAEWANDAKIDEHQPHLEAAKQPYLHSKYLNVLMHHKVVLKSLDMQMRRKTRILMEYYGGSLDADQLKALGREPWNERLTKATATKYVESDEELASLEAKIAINQCIVEAATSIMSEIRSRSHQTKQIIDWQKFINGQ